MDFDCVRNTTFSMMSRRFTPAQRIEQQMIRFRLHLQVDTFNWILHQHSTSPQFVGRNPTSVHVAVATGPRIDLIKTVQRAIDSCGYTLYNDERLQLIYGALFEEAKVFNCGNLILTCRVRVKHRHVYGVVHSPTMVPAADSSLELLEKYEVDGATDGGCCICLEELDDGDGALRMPCSHVFHGDCIKEWLRSSHYCPLCRYEMPTQ